MSAMLSNALFKRALYLEHLEEASFLYQQTLALRGRAAELPWWRVGDFEERLEAHLDALVLGGDAALDVCRDQSEQGDPGELFAAVAVYCRQMRSDLLSACLRQLDFSDEAKLGAVADALKLELPASWTGFVEQAIGRDDRLTLLLTPVCAFRRLPVGETLLQALPKASPASARVILQALGQLKVAPSRTVCRQYLQHQAEAVQEAALGALLRLGDEEALRAHYLIAQKTSWPHQALALGGDASASRVFEQILASGRADPPAVLALGLLGSTTALQPLYDALKQAELAESAALALHWLTGAHLFEDVFIEAPVVEEELSDAELEAWRSEKRPPMREDGTPFGETVRRLCVDKNVWRQWLSDNVPHMDPSLRYRKGQPYSVESLLSNMEEGLAGETLRAFAARELAIRYGCDIAFDTRMPVTKQVQAMREMRAWACNAAASFQPGGWYFGGHRQ
jgi:uncharacterized protein (TIGR02270 family)